MEDAFPEQPPVDAVAGRAASKYLSCSSNIASSIGIGYLLCKPRVSGRSYVSMKDDDMVVIRRVSKREEARLLVR